MPSPTKITWTDPTTNVDNSPLAAGEVTGYTVGVRPAAGVAGTYPVTASIPNPSAASELISSLGSVLAPGSYFVAVQTNGPVNSAWSAEVPFTIAPPQPNPPSGLQVS